MKAQIIFVLALFTQICFGQAYNGTDATLKRVNAELPKDWTISLNGTVLKMEKTDSVWERYVNHINAPSKPLGETPLTEPELLAVFEKYGRKQHLEIAFQVAPLWDAKMWEKAHHHNDSLDALNATFWKKHGISKFYHEANFSKGKAMDESRFEPKTGADSLALRQYEAEKEQVEKVRITLPQLCTENLSLFCFQMDCQGMPYKRMNFSEFYPESAGNELVRVQEIVSRLCHCDESGK